MKIIQIIKAHSILGVYVVITTLTIFMLVGFFVPKVYEVNTSILVHQDLDSLINGDEGVNSGSLVDYVKIIKSDLVLNDVVRNLKKTFPEISLGKTELSKRLRIISAKNTKIIDLKFQSENPDYAVKMLEFTLKSYDKAIRLILKNSKYHSLSLLEERLENIQSQRNQIDNQLAQLESTIGTIDTDKKNEELLKLSSIYQTRLGEINADLGATKQEVRHIEENLKLSKEELQIFGRIKNDSKIQHWLELLGKQQAELTQLSAKFTENHPDVKEKNREVESTHKLISKHVKDLYGKVNVEKMLPLSSFEEKLGQDLIESHIKLKSLQEEKPLYQNLLSNLDHDIAYLAEKKQGIDHLKIQSSQLRTEEDKLVSTINDYSINQTISKNVRRFSIVNPPVKPEQNDHIFPLPFSQLLFSGTLVSFLLSLFSIGIAEYINPVAVDLVSLPVLSKLIANGRSITFETLKSGYQALSLMINRKNIKSLALIHLCSTKSFYHSNRIMGEAGYCQYSPGILARQFSAMFMERGSKVVLVDCSGTILEEESNAVQHIVNVGDYRLYEYAGMDDLKILSPVPGSSTFFDPMLLKQIQKVINYDLVIVNATLSDDALNNQLIGESVDGVILTIQENTNSQKLIQEFQSLNKKRNIQFIGSFLINR